MTKQKIRPLAILTSDIHFSINTLEIASECLFRAVEAARALEVPLYICGDLNDTKAIIRAEVANRLISIIGCGRARINILIGNHDLINEKSKENSLEFLRPYCQVFSVPGMSADGFGIIPYQTNPEDFKRAINSFPDGTIVLCHQGVQGAMMGGYVQDNSAILQEDYKNYRVISGHYHKRQTIGTLDYIGSPYTVSFAEANDPTKGIQLLMSDGTLKHIPTNLRKHVIVETTADNVIAPIKGLSPDDLLWIKVSGLSSDLDQLDKDTIGNIHLGHSNFKLDKIITTNEDMGKLSVENQTDSELLDGIIDQSTENDEHKQYLKDLWRTL